MTFEQAAALKIRLSARIASGAMSVRVARLMLTDVVQGAAHVHECRGGRGS